MWRPIGKLVSRLLLAIAAVGVVFVVGMRTKSPLVLNPVRRAGRASKRFVLKSSGTPGGIASVVRHVGRTSGRPYETPVSAVLADDGLVIALPYGPNTDWLKNVLAAGSATIVHEGDTYPVDRPEVVPMSAVATRLLADRPTHPSVVRRRRLPPGSARGAPDLIWRVRSSKEESGWGIRWQLGVLSPMAMNASWRALRCVVKNHGQLLERRVALSVRRIDGRVHLGTTPSPAGLIGRTREFRCARGSARCRSRRAEPGAGGAGRCGHRQERAAAAPHRRGSRDSRSCMRRAWSPRWSSRSRHFTACARRCCDRLDALPDPQRDAASTAFGLTTGTSPPDRLLIGLAVLNLLCRPLRRRAAVVRRRRRALARS